MEGQFCPYTYSKVGSTTRSLYCTKDIISILDLL